MEPAFEGMLKSILGENQVVERFKLLFPTVSSTVSVSNSVNVSVYNWSGLIVTKNSVKIIEDFVILTEHSVKIWKISSL